MTKPLDPKSWNINAARALYNIDRWGGGYYEINPQGHVSAQPQGGGGAKVDLLEIIREAENRRMATPLLIRFQDILRHRVVQLNEAFQSAIREYQYQGEYRGVFPIKVNQLREVVEEVLDAGKPYRFGLEVGSKPELYAGLALQKEEGDLIICNGYKDEEFIRTALTGVKLNKQVIIVVEKMEELRQIIRISREMKVEPLVGLRLRLHTKGAGKWAKSAGENAKFGLSPAELLTACRMLKEAELSHCFKLIHFHIGSQIPDIKIVKRAAQEAARYYAQFYRMGFQVQYIDVGGGLGVDYDGSRTASESSMNYSLQEYANDVVYYIGDVCKSEKVPPPTSSARADAPWPPTTASWWWRSLDPLKRSARRRTIRWCLPPGTTPSSANSSRCGMISARETGWKCIMTPWKDEPRPTTCSLWECSPSNPWPKSTSSTGRLAPGS